MAVEIFLKLDGVTGSSRNYHHNGWGDVLGWNWSLARVAAPMTGSPAVEMNEITVTKALGIDSPAFMTLLAEGRTVANAKLDIVPVVGKREAQQKYVSMSFDDVTVQEIRVGGTAEESASEEQITLRFARVRFEFHHQGAPAADGKAASSDIHSFESDTNAA